MITYPFEPNPLIDAELADCVPATDPDCPSCGEKLNVIGGSVFLLWACGNNNCKDARIFIWDNGELLPDEIGA